MTGTRRVGDLPDDELGARLRGGGLGVQIGPCRLNLRVPIPSLQPALRRLYEHYPTIAEPAVFSCHAQLTTVRSWPGRPPRVRFAVDGVAPHEDMPAAHALPVLEWGINLVLAMRWQCFLLLHAAVLERGGHALLLPAAPGGGKTTLCVALAHRGWRLFSDEFGLLRPGSVDLLPMPRPMPLKNESIDVIRRYAPAAVLGPVIEGTRKGTVCHVRPPRDSVERAAEPAPARWLVFPQWRAGARLDVEAVPRGEAFMLLATNAFNYGKLGEAAFESVRAIADRSQCYRLVYSDLDDAVAWLDRLAEAAR